jgi:hypothetical protein
MTEPDVEEIRAAAETLQWGRDEIAAQWMLALLSERERLIAERDKAFRQFSDILQVVKEVDGIQTLDGALDEANRENDRHIVKITELEQRALKAEAEVAHYKKELGK